ncbi:MAG: sodium:solute symporter family transporter [Bacillota bacterium]
MKYVFLSVYVLCLIFISWYSVRRVKTVNDFFLGDRNIGPWMSAFAYATTYFSAVIFIGYAGNIGWNFGIAAVMIGVANGLIGNYAAWRVLARRTRSMTQNLNVSTMPDFFEKRYQSKGLKIAAALIIFIFMTPYCASVYTGLSYLFEQTFGIPFIYCILGMAVLTALYLMLGGYLATVLSDMFQGIIMLAGVVVLVALVLSNAAVGGFTQGLQKLAEIDPALTSLTGGAKWLDLIGLIVLTSLGTWGLPQMVHKFYAIKDERSIKSATKLSTLFCFLIAGGAYLSGVFGRLFLNNQLAVDAVTGKPLFDTIMPQVIQIALPEALIGLIVILVLSASMSTLSSLVLISSSAISMDLVKGTLKPKMENKSVVLLMRVLCVVFIGISVFIATNKIDAIVTLMSFSWGALAGSFLAPYLYGLYWKGTTRAGAWAGVVSGVVVTVGLGLFTKIPAPTIGMISMLAGVVIVPLVSLMTPKMAKEHLDQVFALEDRRKAEKSAKSAA